MRSGDESSSENNSSESGSQDGGDYDETDHLIHVISGTATQEQTEAGVTQTPSEATPPTTVSVVEREFDSHGAHKGSNDSWTSGSSEESGTPIVRSDSNQAFNTAAAEGIAGHLSNDRASLVDLRQQPVVKFDEKDDDELDLDLDLDLDNVMGGQLPYQKHGPS